MEQLSQKIAKLLLDIDAIGFSVDEPIKFKSGIISPVYTDNRSLPFYPDQWETIINGFASLIASESLEFDVIAGIAAAGIPHSSALAYQLKQPSIFIRKEPKEHGKKQRIEGGDVSGKKVILVEDLVTTGGSSLSGVEALRNAGAIVTDCLAITTYGFQKATENFANANVNLHPLTNFDVVWQVAKTQGLSEKTIKAVETWKQNPEAWGK